MPVAFTPTTVVNPVGVQGNYPQNLPFGSEGALADLQAYVSRSFRNQSGAVIPFGCLVSTDNTPTTNDPFAIDITTSGLISLAVGIASDVNVFETAGGGIYNTGSTDTDGRQGYPNLQTVSVVSKGVIWVYSSHAIALGDPVRYYGVSNHPTVSGSFLGRWGKTAVTGRTHLVTSGMRWVTEVAGPGLAQLEIDMPSLVIAAVD